jgi:hypothetical protein
MRTKTFNLLAAALLGVATAGGYAVAQTAGTGDTPAATDAGTPGQGHRFGRFARGAAWANDPVHAVMRDMIQLERLYVLDGRAQDVPGLYQDLLNRTQNAQLRAFAYKRIARQQARPTNPSQVIATVKQSLDENLSRVQ